MARELSLYLSRGELCSRRAVSPGPRCRAGTGGRGGPHSRGGDCAGVKRGALAFSLRACVAPVESLSRRCGRGTYMASRFPMNGRYAGRRPRQAPLQSHDRIGEPIFGEVRPQPLASPQEPGRPVSLHVEANRGRIESLGSAGAASTRPPRVRCTRVGQRADRQRQVPYADPPYSAHRASACQG
jgi:hypothetical protein